MHHSCSSIHYKLYHFLASNTTFIIIDIISARNYFWATVIITQHYSLNHFHGSTTKLHNFNKSKQPILSSNMHHSGSFITIFLYIQPDFPCYFSNLLGNKWISYCRLRLSSSHYQRAIFNSLNGSVQTQSSVELATMGCATNCIAISCTSQFVSWWNSLSATNIILQKCQIQFWK